MAFSSQFLIFCLLAVLSYAIRADFASSSNPFRSVSLNKNDFQSRHNEHKNDTKNGSLGWNWEMWWTYDGISGPEFWGVINPAFSMCTDGRRQSPINLDPRTVLHDPNLTPIKLDKATVTGDLVNTGHNLEWRIHNSDRTVPVKLSGGPLSYSYSLSFFRLHFGERDLQGSEHTIANYAFPAELQLYGYNSQLYKNLTHAANQVYGIAAIAVLIQLGDRTSPALDVIFEDLSKVKFGGSMTPTRKVLTTGLLPMTEQYLTYEGSLTVPACHETVTWIIPNKPLYIAFSLMRELRSLRQGASPHHRNAPLGNNFRPLQS